MKKENKTIQVRELDDNDLVRELERALQRKRKDKLPSFIQDEAEKMKDRIYLGRNLSFHTDGTKRVGWINKIDDKFWAQTGDYQIDMKNLLPESRDKLIGDLCAGGIFHEISYGTIKFTNNLVFDDKDNDVKYRVKGASFYNREVPLTFIGEKQIGDNKPIIISDKSGTSEMGLPSYCLTKVLDEIIIEKKIQREDSQKQRSFILDKLNNKLAELTPNIGDGLQFVGRESYFYDKLLVNFGSHYYRGFIGHDDFYMNGFLDKMSSYSLTKMLNAVSNHGQVAAERFSMAIKIRNSLIDRTTNPAHTSFSEEEKNLINKYSESISKSKHPEDILTAIKAMASKDENVQKCPETWLNDAKAEFDAIVQNKEYKCSTHQTMHI